MKSDKLMKQWIQSKTVLFMLQWYLWFYRAHRDDWNGKILCLKRWIFLQKCLWCAVYWWVVSLQAWFAGWLFIPASVNCGVATKRKGISLVLQGAQSRLKRQNTQSYKWWISFWNGADDSPFTDELFLWKQSFWVFLYSIHCAPASVVEFVPSQ